MATITKGKTFSNGELVTPATLHALVDSATVANIVNADIAANAAIADTKLAQITTVGKVLPAAVQGTAVITTDSRLSDARTPTAHNHDDRYYTESEIDTKLSGLPVSGHTHTIANVTGLQAALDGKQASGSYAPATGIAQSAVTNLTTDLAAKAASSHTHTIANVTGLQAALDGKQASGSYAPATGISPDAITGAAVITTDSRLSNARFPTFHTHSADHITSGTLSNNFLNAASLNAVNNLVLRDANGNFFAGTITANLTGTASGNALSSHTHTIANVTGLQTALDGKQASGSYVANGGNVSTIQRVTSMPASPDANTLYIVIP
jgi:hypothetical protein